MEFRNPYFTDQSKLDLLARWLIVHSIIYYELNDSVVSDAMFDNNCKQYVALAKANPQAKKLSAYGNIMKGFDGSTGFDLYTRCKKVNREVANKLWGDANYVLSNFGGGKK